MRQAGAVVKTLNKATKALTERVMISPAIGEIRMTELMKLCATGDVDGVESCLDGLLRSSASAEAVEGVMREELDARDDWAGSTPLHWAAFAGSTDVVQRLLAVHADPDAVNMRDASKPIHLAARYDRGGALEALATAAPHTLLSRSGRGNTPLHEGAIEGKLGSVRSIIEIGGRLDGQHRLDEEGQPITLKALFEARTDVEGGGNTPLLAAVEYGHSEAIRLLLDARADPTVEASASTTVGAVEKRQSTRLSMGVQAVVDRRKLTQRLSSSNLVQLKRGGTANNLADTSGGTTRSAADQSRFWSIAGHGALSLALSAGHLDVAVQILQVERYPAVLSFAQLEALVLDVWLNQVDPNASPSRDRVKVMRLHDAAAILEFIASGVLSAADRATIESESTKGFNPWSMGKNVTVVPRVARDLFVHESIEHAARHEMMIFISQPLVYAHLQEVFWPLAARMEWPTIAWLALFNLLMLPLLPFVPREWEARLEERLRDASQDDSEGAPRFPTLLVWLLPLGRYALWFLATLGLAQLATNAEPHPDSYGLCDLALLLYLVGWAKGEVEEAIDDVKRDGRVGIRRYLTDPFNILDMLLILLMAACTCTRYSYITDPDAPFARLTLPCQALLALVSWLRLMQVLFIFATSGPLLIMTIRMLEDLWQFMMLSSFVVVAFACAFYVLWHGSSTFGGDGSGAEEEPGGEGDESSARNVVQVLGLLIETTLKGEPDHIFEDGPPEHTLFAWAVMFLFGVVVVLLLLNLLIARFAKTFDMIYENVDAHFKVAFAKIVTESRTKDLLPPPLNVLRLVIQPLYAAAAHLAERAEGAGLCVKPARWRVRAVLAYAQLAGGDDGDGGGGATPVDGDAGDDGDPSAHGDGKDGGGGSGGGSKSDELVRAQVRNYISRAIELGDESGLIRQVVDFVFLRQFDVGREEQWRTEMTRQIHNVEMELKSQMETLRGDVAKVDERVGGVEARMATQAAALDVRLKGIEEAMAAFGAKLQVPEETYPSPRSSTPMAVGLPWSPRAAQMPPAQVASRDGRENLSFDL